MSASEDPATDGAPSVRKTRDEIRAMSNAEFAESLRAAQAAGGGVSNGLCKRGSPTLKEIDCEHDQAGEEERARA